MRRHPVVRLAVPGVEFEDGEVGSVEVVKAAPYGMTAAAIEAVKRWTYTPARLDGRPIAVVNRVTVRFDLTGAPHE